ncbi:MAG: hypothetical protein ACPGLV_12335 [Bacteroidia bacterium]
MNKAKFWLILLGANVVVCLGLLVALLTFKAQEHQLDDQIISSKIQIVKSSINR